MVLQLVDPDAPLTEGEALERIPALPPDDVKVAALARRWGWTRQKARIAVQKWTKTGLLMVERKSSTQRAPGLPKAPQLQMPPLSKEPPAPLLPPPDAPMVSVAVPVDLVPAVAAPAPPEPDRPREGTGALRATTFLAVLSLATCSAAFSISGLTAIFAGAFWAVIGMGVAFELGKLTAVATIGRRYGSGALRLALVVLVSVLMVLNSIGVYGFLSRAHIEHALAGTVIVANKAADVESRLEAKQADLDDIKARIAQLDQTRTVATKRHTRTTTIGNQGPARAALVREREAAENVIAGLRIEKAKVEGERKAVEADLGPVRYLATLLGSTDEQTMRWFILVVALLLDPAAVLLLLAATHRGRR